MLRNRVSDRQTQFIDEHRQRRAMLASQANVMLAVVSLVTGASFYVVSLAT